MPIRILAALALSLALGAQAQNRPDPASISEKEAQARLESVRAEIRALSQAVQATDNERSEATRALRALETAIADSIGEVRAIDEQLASQKEKLAELEQTRTGLSEKLAAQREALAVLLRSAYALGRSEELKLLLQQEDVGEIARVLAYHRYFQRARVERIDDLLEDLNQLAVVQLAIEQQNLELDATRAQSEQEAEVLRGQRVEREAMLVELDQRLDSQQARLALMAKDEKGLVQLLERLQDVFADIPEQPDGAEPFARLRGQLPMPVDGTVLVRFGGNDTNGRRLSGWLIGAASGTPVKAVARGRVAYADWLKGYGMLLILDHGDGYMSLYGYNDSLRRDVGDWVSAGEIVATTGSSGGQRSAALYFELRNQGKAVNPKSWLR
ncbi:murein hydrolase activator EnvC family protein [Dokdonella sp.]|uniref:murein hydrolase activator EnvC family protein n=1 Tax=Dokdonella sp. TaxID=2291710 RepID=UPI003C473C6A